jgi:hypothetical protein
MARPPAARDGRSMHDDSDVLGEIRQRLVEHGEPSEAYTDDDLRAALRIAWIELAIEYAEDGGKTTHPRPTANSGYPPRGPAGGTSTVVGPPLEGTSTCEHAFASERGPTSGSDARSRHDGSPTPYRLRRTFRGST